MIRTTRTPRIVATAAALVAVAVVASGCGPYADPEPSRSLPPVSEGVDAALLPFYEQSLDWASCGGELDCTTVTAPLNWSDPAAGEIELSVVRHRAEASEPLGSLLTNPGGPGASGVSLVRDSLSYAVGQPLIENYDVIGFDPRGVGESTAVRCFDAADMDAYLFDIPDAERDTPAWEAAIVAGQEEFAAACDQNSDGILPYIDTVSAARDLDLLRAVLGDEKLNYLGYSYGTFLGATYAGLYPDKVGRMVLDGAIDPTLSSLEVSAEQAIGFEASLRAFLQWCLGQDACPFAGTVDDGMSDLSILLASVGRDPLLASDGRRLGSDALLTAIVAALYSEDSWPALVGALSETVQGRADEAFRLADFYYNRVDGEYLDNSTEAFTAYNCLDYPADDTPEREAAYEARLAAEAPTVAPYWSGVNVCEVWPVAPTGTRAAITAPGAAPILVVGTTGDPATPYDWSVALADQLSSGVLVTRVGEGHTGYNKGNTCVDDAIEAYFLEGTVPTDGLRCE